RVLVVSLIADCARDGLVDGVEGSVPAGFAEEMCELIEGEADLVGKALRFDLAFGGFEGPVDEERAANEIGARNESPVAAVEAVGAVVAHDEEAVGRDDEVKAADVGRQIEGPLGRDTRDVGGWHGGEVVAVGVVVGGGGFGGAGFDLLEAVEVEDAAAKVDAVAGNPDDAFNE